MEKKESNRIIAEFDGWVYVPTSENEFTNEHYEKSEDWCSINSFIYDTSWNALMPVVEKIITHEYDNGEDHAYLRTFGKSTIDGKFLVRFNRCPVYEGKTLIDATYNAVIDFITSPNFLSL